MKKLYLLRHAQAESSYNLSDKERPLSDKGINDSILLGKYMHSENILPDLIKCSPADRTKQTCRNLLIGLNNNEIDVHYCGNLYNAATIDIFEELKATTDDIDTLMVIAHNPGIHMIGQFLAEQGDESALQMHSISYPPNTMTVINCNIKTWKDLKPAINTMSQYIDNKIYEAA